MTAYYKKLGSRLKKIREDKELTIIYAASCLGLNRIALAQMEAGVRKLSAEELVRFSRFYDVPVNVLLDFEKDIEVIIETKSADLKPSPLPQRISVPQKKLAKFKEVLLYILNRVGSKPNIGETVLYKLLYFIDFNYYEKYEEQLVGATYIKNHYGPTPKEFARIVRDMQDNDLIKVESRYFEFPQVKYLPRRAPDLNLINANEVKLIDEVLDRLSDMTAAQISEYSHNDVPWQTAEEGKPIDYESVFYRTAPYSVRTYSEEDFS